MIRSALIGIGLGLVATLLLQWRDWDPRPQLPAADTEAAGTATEAAAAGQLDLADLLTPPPPQQEYASVIERTLFLPDRRVPDAGSAPESEGPQTEPADDRVLAGLDFSAVLLQDDTSIAWVRLPREPGLRRWRKGDTYEGWTVTDIQDGVLTLTSHGTVRHIPLLDFSARVPTRAPTGRPKPVTGPPPPLRAAEEPPQAEPEQ